MKKQAHTHAAPAPQIMPNMLPDEAQIEVSAEELYLHMLNEAKGRLRGFEIENSRLKLTNGKLTERIAALVAERAVKN